MIYGYGHPQIHCYVPFPSAVPTPAATPTPVAIVPSRQAGESDGAAWRRILAAAPIAPMSQWTPPGVQPISAFDGALRLPPAMNPVTGGVAIRGAGAWTTQLRFQPATGELMEVPHPWYQIFLGQGPLGFPQATLAGSAGVEAFERAIDIGECPVGDDDLYCSSPASSPGGLGGTEWFLGLEVAGLPAVMVHSIRPINSPDGWYLTWYDPAVDMSYTFSAYRCDEECGSLDLAARFGVARELSPESRAAAEAIAQFASTFVEVRMAP